MLGALFVQAQSYLDRARCKSGPVCELKPRALLIGWQRWACPLRIQGYDEYGGRCIDSEEGLLAGPFYIRSGPVAWKSDHFLFVWNPIYKSRARIQNRTPIWYPTSKRAQSVSVLVFLPSSITFTRAPVKIRTRVIFGHEMWNNLGPEKRCARISLGPYY